MPADEKLAAMTRDANQPATYSLRPADVSDAPEVTDLVKAAYRHYIERIGRSPRPMTEDYVAVIRDRQVTVAESLATIVGVIVLDRTDEGFLIDNVAVRPSHQGTGLGKLLLDFAETEARKAGFDSIYLYTHEKMTENRTLYSRRGYLRFEPHLDSLPFVVYMRKPLVGAA
jgi:GNAT superfamily N-acetyltransferase